MNGAGAAPAAVLEPDDARTATAPRALVADADIELSDEILLLRRRLGAMARDLETSEAEVRLLRRELAARPTDGAVVPRGGASQPARDEKRRSLLAKIVEQNVALRNATS